MMVIMHIWTH